MDARIMSWILKNITLYFKGHLEKTLEVISN